MLETVLMVSTGCTLLGLGCWNIQLHRSIIQIQARHASERARADAALHALTARVSGLDAMTPLPGAPIPPSSPASAAAAQGTREAQALEMAADGAGRHEIAERLSMRPADVDLLVKVASYRRQAG